MTLRARASNERNDNRSTGEGGKVRLGAVLVLGIAGAAIGLLITLISGYGFLGVAAGYVGGGLAATILAALTLYLREATGGNR